MCNLYTLRLSAWNVRNLMQHHKLIGKELVEAMRGRNEPKNFYPNYEAPVVVVRDGERVVETLPWRRSTSCLSVPPTRPRTRRSSP